MGTWERRDDLQRYLYVSRLFVAHLAGRHEPDRTGLSRGLGSARHLCLCVPDLGVHALDEWIQLPGRLRLRLPDGDVDQAGFTGGHPGESSGSDGARWVEAA